MKKTLFLYLSLFLSVFVHAQTDTSQVELDPEAAIAAYRVYADSVASTFKYQTGTVQLGNGVATLKVPAGYKYLDAASANIVLVDLWGNPPAANEEDKSLGLLFPENSGPTDTNSVHAIDITYSEEGYIDDSDAKDLDYDDLLKQMKEDTKAANEYRTKEGYPAIELMGWASAPYYDAANKKLHWAKELHFDEQEGNTLNYNIRILGRKGYLQLNAIGDMDVLPGVKKDIEPILASVDFNDGYRYRDFDSNVDKVAAVGIGGLIAGKVLMKAGLLAKLGIILAKFWKVIALGFVAALGSIRQFLTNKKKEGEMPTPQDPAASA
ncbi:MAG: DUF2167 domain-containing protein [Saprospiraceae bacterium]|nr:DUF2167 domain-containing protein [Saprospiraceae bacterium]